MLKKITLLLLFTLVANAKVPMSVSTSMTTTSSVKEYEAYGNAFMTTLGLDLSYPIAENYSLATGISVTKDMKHDRDSDVNNSSIAISGPIVEISKDAKLNGSVSAMLPMNRETREQAKMYTRISAGPTLVLDLKRIGLKYVKLSLGTQFGKGFYQYERAVGGSPNTNYSISNTAALSYNPKEKWIFSAYVRNSQSWNYNNTLLPDQFGMGQSVTFVASKKFSISAGHEVGGRAFKYNNEDSYIKFFDKNRSSVYSTLSYVF